MVIGVVGLALPTLADEEPKRGGTLNYMIPPDAPPSFDGHREATYATVHSARAVLQSDDSRSVRLADLVERWADRF